MLLNFTGKCPFRWNAARKQAAERVASDRLTDAEIAAEAGVHRATLARWKVRPEFAQRVREIVDAYGAELRKRMIADVWKS